MRHVSFHHAIISHDETPPLCLRGTGAGLKRKTRSRTTGPTRHHVPDETRLKTRGSGRSPGKAHAMTRTSPLKGPLNRKRKKKHPEREHGSHGRVRAMPIGNGAPHHASMETIRSTPLHMSIVDRTAHPPSEWWTDTTGHGRGSRKKPGRHAGRGTPATSLDSRDMDPCGLPGSSHVVNALRCESVVVDACARQRRRFMVLRRCRGTCQRPQDRFFAYRSPCREMWTKPVRPVRDP